MDNKDRFMAFAKAAFLLIWGVIACIASAAVWNAAAADAKPDTFVCVMIGVNLAINFVAIFIVKKQLFKDDK